MPRTNRRIRRSSVRRRCGCCAAVRGRLSSSRPSWGCSPQTLSNWLRQDQADRGERTDTLTSEERQRLRELERENKVLRQEREILKRAAAFFARETDRP